MMNSKVGRKDAFQAGSTGEVKHLPNGWEVMKLEDLYDITSSKRVFESEWKKEGIPFYRAREIVKLAKYGFVNNELFISEEMYNQYALKYGIPKENDIMVTGVGTLGICYVVKKTDKFYFKDGNIIWLKTKNGVNSQYVEYAFKSEYLRKQIDDSVGATVGTYTIIKAKNTLIPLPPLPEQKRIVAILDEAFTAITLAKENAQKNLVNARELFESYLQGVFANPGDDWEKKTLGEITEVKDGTHDSPKYIKEGIPFVTQKNIKQNGLSFEDTKFITKTDHEKFYKRSNVTYGDILISMIGANRGMAAIVDDKRIFSIKNVGLIKASENINKYFILYYLKSSIAMKYVLYMSNGGAQEFVGLTALRSFPISFPKKQDQETIVKKFDALSSETKKLEAIYMQKIKDLDELKKSILDKAFKGGL